MYHASINTAQASLINMPSSWRLAPHPCPAIRNWQRLKADDKTSINSPWVEPNKKRKITKTDDPEVERLYIYLLYNTYTTLDYKLYHSPTTQIPWTRFSTLPPPSILHKTKSNFNWKAVVANCRLRKVWQCSRHKVSIMLIKSWNRVRRMPCDSNCRGYWDLIEPKMGKT